MKTTLVRRPPFIDLEPMDRWVNTMLSGMGFGSLVRTYLPAADVYVSDGSYVVELETQGLGRLRVHVRDDLKRTWARETRLERQQKQLEGTTPQLTGKYAKA